jgi:hypothetical protein
VESNLVWKALRKGWKISHPKRPEVEYELLGPIKVKIDGEWVMYIQFTDHDDVYAREPDDFKKFTIRES